MHSILIKPVFSDHLSYVTLSWCSLEKSHQAGLTALALAAIQVSINSLPINLITTRNHWKIQTAIPIQH